MEKTQLLRSSAGQLNTKRALLMLGGVLLSSRNALAGATNVSSTDVVGNLGMFSILAGQIMTYAKYIAFFLAIVSLLALWVSGMLGKIHHKVETAINAQEGLKKWLIEGVLVIVAFIILFDWIIPTINGFIPGA